MRNFFRRTLVSTEAPRKLAGGLVLAAVTLVAGCSSAPVEQDVPTLEIHVFAAASLSKPFSQLEAAFEAEHDGIDLVMNYAGSQDLVAQMQAGAPSDVFASANVSWMQTAIDEGLVSELTPMYAQGPPIFAANSIAVGVAAGNPHNIHSLDDLAEDEDLVVARCAPAVPCGAVTDRLLESSGVSISFDTEQNSVTETLALLIQGEADAVFVYDSDIAGASPSVDRVEVPLVADIITEYPIALTTHAENGPRSEPASLFIEFVLGERGSSVLENAGFRLPGTYPAQ